MIELPEARTIAKQLQKEIVGKRITQIMGDFTDHKFTFYFKDPAKYNDLIKGKRVTTIVPRNFYVEIEIEDYRLIMRDGTIIRYFEKGNEIPAKSKLLIMFDDDSFLNITVAMYGYIGIFHKDENLSNPYYEMELRGVGVLDDAFTLKYFLSLINDETQKLSTKAFLATEQRILGIGNGVVQDILFNAKIHPKRKMKDLNKKEIESLYQVTKNTIKKMTYGGGRDTEKDIYGNNGGYVTILSSKTYKKEVCPNCQSTFKKESFLGGSIYFCPSCQLSEYKC